MDGTGMDYVSFGYGGQPVIILPGLSDGLATVRGKALLLAGPYRPFFERFTVYMFSRKTLLPDKYSIRDMAGDQAKAMTALGLENACVMGVSQGGMIAQYLAVDHPELVKRLVLAVTAPYANALARERINRWANLARQGNHKQLMIDTAEASYSPAMLSRYRKIYPVICFVGKPSGYERFLINAGAILGFNAVDELNRIKCPTLIIGGEEDRIVGVQASRELNQGIPDSRLFIYPGLGHAAYEEAKDFNRRIFSFFSAG